MQKQLVPQQSAQRPSLPAAPPEQTTQDFPQQLDQANAACEKAMGLEKAGAYAEAKEMYMSAAGLYFEAHPLVSNTTQAQVQAQATQVIARAEMLQTAMELPSAPVAAPRY